ncbi:MAG: hypothetical protein KAU21_20165, partial [Gammaproteobacteria bacterium]|nr:hypothetical protein [Gammaproteobacteria bacterium]
MVDADQGITSGNDANLEADIKDQNSVADRYARFVIKYRWAVIIFLFLFTIAGALFIKDVNLRNDPDSLLPLSNRYIATNLYNELHYGMGNIMVWGVKV